MSNLQAEDPLAVEVVKAIHSGDMEALQRLLVENPSLATTRIVEITWSFDRPLESRQLFRRRWTGRFAGGD